jgi:hypothetical protein
MSKIKLYLDDVRTPTEEGWTVVRNYEEFVDAINEYGLDGIDLISLDHDLGDQAMYEYYTNVKNNYLLDYKNIEEKTGMDCCKFMVNLSLDTNIPLPEVLVHSANPIGSSNMMGYINNYLMNCRLPQNCIRVTIPHIIEEKFHMSPELRKAKWDRSGK